MGSALGGGGPPDTSSSTSSAAAAAAAWVAALNDSTGNSCPSTHSTHSWRTTACDKREGRWGGLRCRPRNAMHPVHHQQAQAIETKLGLACCTFASLFHRCLQGAAKAAAGREGRRGEEGASPAASVQPPRGTGRPSRLAI